MSEERYITREEFRRFASALISALDDIASRSGYGSQSGICQTAFREDNGKATELGKLDEEINSIIGYIEGLYP